MEPQLTIGEPDFRNAPFPSDMCAAWAHYPRINITWDMLINQTTAREQSSNEKLSRNDIKCVPLVNNCRDKSVFVANHESVFQVAASVPCDSSGVANSFEARFVDFFARWLFTREASCANLTFIDVVKL